jgi:hypothetical protein
MIGNIEALLPWDENELEVTLERHKYIGTDPRLNFGDVYDLTVRRDGGPKGPVNISVHVGLKERIYLRYDSNRAFKGDWLDE